MPQTPARSLDERLEAAIEEHSAELEKLARDAVDAEVGRLLEAEIRQRTNGASRNGQPHTVKDGSGPFAAPSVRRCKVCARDLPMASFEKNRHTCRECRQQQARDRERTAAASEADRPDDDG